MITGAEAERIGLVSNAVPRDQVLDEALRVAGGLAEGSQLAIRWTKRALIGWLKMAGPIFDQSAAYEMLTFMGPDVIEAPPRSPKGARPGFPPPARAESPAGRICRANSASVRRGSALGSAWARQHDGRRARGRPMTQRGKE